MTSPNNFTIEDSIQTDTAINHGNSGGPLLNVQGKVIGITTQIQSDSGGNEGVGFAVPSNTVQTIARKLIATGKAEHAFLGVSLDRRFGRRGAPHRDSSRHARRSRRPSGGRRHHVVRRHEDHVLRRTQSPRRHEGARRHRHRHVHARRQVAHGEGHAGLAAVSSPRSLTASSGDDAPAHLAERLAAQHDLVAVGEKRALVPRELDQAAALVRSPGRRSSRTRAGRPCAGSRRST